MSLRVSIQDTNNNCRSLLPAPLLFSFFQERVGVGSDVRKTVRESASTFFKALGATVVDISIPIHQDGPIIWTAATRPSMSNWLCQGRPSGHLSYLPPHIQPKWAPSQNTFETVNLCNPAVNNIILSEQFSRRLPSTGTTEAKAHRKVFELRAAYDKALEDVDVIVTPCAPTIAMPNPKAVDSDSRPLSVLERLEYPIGLTSNTCPFNVTGHPALSVPCGLSSPPSRPDVSIPIGMQLIGRRWRDEQVIMAAALFESGRDSSVQ